MNGPAYQERDAGPTSTGKRAVRPADVIWILAIVRFETSGALTIQPFVCCELSLFMTVFAKPRT